MAFNALVTNEGEMEIFKSWFDVLPSRNLKVYAVITPLTKPTSQYTYADKATVTHPNFVNVNPPDEITFNQPGPISNDPYASVNFLNWRVVNNTGTTRTVYGFLFIDETAQRSILCSPSFAPFNLAPGASVAFDYYFFLQGTDDPNP